MIQWVCKKVRDEKQVGLILLASFMLLGMGTGEKKTSEVLEPTYTPLADDQEHFVGTITSDGKEITTLHDLSFSGTTKLVSLRQDDDKSYSDADLAVISKIVVKDADYRSPEHSNAPEEPLYVKAEIVFNSGIKKEYLLPHKLEISGVEATTGVQKTWRMSTLKEVEVKEKLPTPEPVFAPQEQKPAAELEEPSFLRRAGNYIRSVLP